MYSCNLQHPEVGEMVTCLVCCYSEFPQASAATELLDPVLPSLVGRAASRGKVAGLKGSNIVLVAKQRKNATLQGLYSLASPSSASSCSSIPASFSLPFLRSNTLASVFLGLQGTYI